MMEIPEHTMSPLQAWLLAFRLRTLPLSLSSILLGSLLAYSEGSWNTPVFLLLVLTTLFIQILSNLANDYGDGVKGTDGDKRIGPQRAIQSGIISQETNEKSHSRLRNPHIFHGAFFDIFGNPQLSIYYFLGFVSLGVFAIWRPLNIRWEKGPMGTMEGRFVLYFYFLDL